MSLYQTYLHAKAYQASSTKANLGKVTTTPSPDPPLKFQERPTTRSKFPRFSLTSGGHTLIACNNLFVWNSFAKFFEGFIFGFQNLSLISDGDVL